ncbi:PREDICTED: protein DETOXIFICATION 52-like [Tarenaya hassleriana]|uniref:protein DETOXIFICATION 52-like n=1 Tax=Tarenaya hassleriana TaxID=28532 RepID=UPI00053C7136|nr:PREDICTED: protein DETOXIFICATION 52-like [Tarenaya hassleriana]
MENPNISDHKNSSTGPDPESEPDQTRIFPSISQIISEGESLFSIAFPTILAALILYVRSAISMIFLGHLGELELAGGSLAIAFANITGYSVLSGLALGMDPLCSQAFGAEKPKLLSLTLQRTVLFLLACSVGILVLWLNLEKIMIFLHQDPTISSLAQVYVLCSIPDLVTNSVLHPLRIYLRAQGITHPLTLATLAGTIFHIPINFFLVSYLQMGLVGVAMAASASNFFVLMFLVFYIWFTGLHRATWTNPSSECFKDWGPLIHLAAPSCVSVCLEWWWYEIMTVLCGLLANPKAPIAAMGILIQTTSLLYIFPSSLGFAISTRVGNELGSNRPHNARLAATVAVAFAGLMGLTAFAFAWGVSNIWGKMFTRDIEIINLTALVLPILGLCEIGNCPQTVGCGVLRGSARPSTAANINLGAFYLVGMPVAVGLAFRTGIGFCGLWLGLLAAQISCAVMMLYIVGSTDWEGEAKRAKVLTCTGVDVVITAQDSDDLTDPLYSVSVTTN